MKREPLTLIRMYPHVPSNFFACRVGKVLDVVLLGDLFFGLRVGECCLEHAGGADKAVVGTALEEGANASVVVASREMREPVTQARAGVGGRLTIKKYDSGNLRLEPREKMPLVPRSLGRGTRKWA